MKVLIIFLWLYLSYFLIGIFYNVIKLIKEEMEYRKIMKDAKKIIIDYKAYETKVKNPKYYVLDDKDIRKIKGG